RVGGARDDRVDDIGGQYQVSRLVLEILVVGLGLQTFHRTALTAEHVERVADGAAQRNQIENPAGRLATRLRRRGLLPGGGCVSLYLREEHAITGAQVVLTLTQAGLGRLEGRIIGDGLPDHRVQLR